MIAVLEAREISAEFLSTLQPELVQHFELLATAPDGVAKLRQLILTLALQGKLVPQDPSDEPAKEVLQQIRAEKGRLASGYKVKNARPLKHVSETERLFALPRGWEWIRLGEVFSLEYGASLPAKERLAGDIPVFGSNGIVGFHTAALIKEPSLIIGRKGSVGEVNLSLVPFWPIDTSYYVTPPKGIDLLFAYHLLRSLRLGRHDKATAIPGINRNDVYAEMVGLPPTAEQSRIVTRVEELMRLCDALEVKGRLEAAQHAQLVQTLLGALTASSSSEELADNWQRVATHFDLLLDRPEAIDALEQTILQLAVRGLLVPQDPKDGPASELIKEIRAEKDRLIAAGRVKRDKSLPLISTGAQPFPLPPGWAWVRLPEVCEVSGGATPSKAVPQNWQGSIPWVSPKDMKVQRISDAQDHVSEAAVGGSLSLIPSGSLLMVVRGMILAHSFPVAETLVPVTINQDMKALTPFEPAVLPFLALACLGLKPQILALIDRSTHGTCKLESPKIFGTLFPLPPLAEQSRIVTRVESLRRLCADLRQRLVARHATQALLAEALIDEVA